MKRLSYLGFLCALAMVGCGDDSTAKGGDGGNDAGGDAGSHPGHMDKDAGGGGNKDASVAKDAAVGGGDAAVDAGPTVGEDAGNQEDAGSTPMAENQFHVPSAGGKFTFKTKSGAMVSFDFPADAAGKDITVTPVDKSSVTFASTDVGASLADVIELGPSGTTFSTPVKVNVAGGALMVFNFHDPAKPGDPLLLSADGKTLELTHFSTLGVVSPDQACQSTSGWSDNANDQTCSSSGSATTLRSYGCKNYEFCYFITASCCVDPTNPDTACKLGDKNLALTYKRTDSNGGAYPYCDLAGGTGSMPYVQGHTPDQLIRTGGDQLLTLTGTGFKAGGSMLIQGDIVITSTRDSDTSVHATVPGSDLSGNILSSVGYVNPKSDATGDCTAQTLANCDLVNGRSNLVNIVLSNPAN